VQQEVEFFGKYGFSNPMLIALGAIQLIDGNIPLSIVTALATLMLGIVMKRSWKARPSES
jgi:hypothetical protein